MNFYFDKFPVIEYSNTAARDITSRVRLGDEFRENEGAFYPYEIKSDLRSDQIGDAYYSDSYLEWLVYLSNGILDPYYDWPMSEEEFEAFIAKKYGSPESAMKIVKFFRVNWESMAELTIPPSFYNSTLPNVLKKYYTPVMDNFGRIFEYKRQENDWQVNTNKVISYEIALSNTDTKFSEDEVVDISHSGSVIGTATVVASNTSILFLQHIVGNTTANSSYSVSISGETSNAVATSSNSDLVEQVISNTEAIYWSPVYAYDWEREKNEKNKTIILLDARYARDVSEELRQKLKVE